MRRIMTLNANPYQRVSFVTDTNKEAVFTFRYLPTQKSWFFDLVYEDFEVNMVRVCCYPNLLDKWRNLLDFGVNVSTDNGLDPFEITAFDDGSCFFSILNEDEKNQATEYLDGV